MSKRLSENEKEKLLEAVSIALASGLAIEASVHKPGNVSPLKPAKNMYYHGFILASIGISHSIKNLLIEVERSGKSDCVDLGYILRRLYEGGEALHGMGNLHLGFVFLISPLVGALPSYINTYFAEPRYLLGARELYSVLLDRAYEYLLTCGKGSRLIHVWSVLRKIIDPDSYLHRGSTPDIYVSDDAMKSFWDLVYYGKETDLILRELYSNYQISRKYSREIVFCEDKDLYTRIHDVFLEISSNYLDTHIARRNSVADAYLLRENMRLCAGKEGSFRDECLDLFDKAYRERGINPGSIADIVAFMISLRYIVRVLEDFSLSR